MSDRKLDLGNVMEQALRPSPTKVPRPLEQRVEQLETLLREAVDLAFHNSEQTCQYCNADSEHDSDCLVTKANELLTN